MRIASPGNTLTHQIDRSREPAAIIAPHSGAGGRGPSPRKDSAASMSTALPSSSVASTTAGPTLFGTTSRRSACQGPTPSSREDARKSELRMLSTALRMTRA